MENLNARALEAYIKKTFGQNCVLKGVGEIGSLDKQGMKDFGYGKPIMVSFEQDGILKEVVFSMMRGDKYGHQFYWDRASVLMFQYEAGSKLKKHVRPMGLGYVNEQGEMIPVEKVKEFFIVNEKVEGWDYFLNLERIREEGVTDKDVELAKKFARWLAEIHGNKKNDPDLYLRRVRQLIGDSECIWGLIDAYPYPYEDFPQDRFIRLEKQLIEWRWKLRMYGHRLSATHGDFHPWNVLVTEENNFWVLDRSRGEWGEPADDVATMSCNYFLYGLYREPAFSGPFKRLYLTFWEEYLKQTNDEEILDVIAPFYVFRGLVIASPEWYPNHPDSVRKGLFRFLENILCDERFDYEHIDKYMK